MNIRWIVGTAVLVSVGGCFAATLDPLSLVCESPEPLAFVKNNQYIAGAKADYIMGSATRQLQMANLTAANSSILTARQKLEADRSRSDVEQYQAIIGTCANSGAVALPTEVIELKPISGVAKVKVSVNGQQVVVFTNASSVK